jgi:hypothetical protein
MRRVILSVAAVVIGFVVGVGASRLWWSSQTLPYCEVARNAEWYHNRMVRVKARLIFGSGGMYVFEECNPVEALASKVELKGASGTGGRGYVDEVLVSGEKPQVKKVDAIIEGRFNAKFSKGCWGPKYHIAATKIELMSAVTDFKPVPRDETSRRTRH